MAQGPIENPVINSPFVEPAQHFLTSADGTVTGEIVEGRRPSEFFVPVARPKKTSGQLTLDAFGPPTRQQPNEIVNEIRAAVDRWRIQGYPHVTPTTRDLLAYWRGGGPRAAPVLLPDRGRRDGDLPDRGRRADR